MGNAVEIYDKAFADYVSELKHTGNSEATINNYSKSIRFFREHWLNNNPAPEKAPSVSDVRAWRDSLIESGVSMASTKQYLTRLKCFFTFATDPDLSDERYFEINPVVKKLFPNCKGESTKPYEKVFTADDLKKLWANVKVGNNKYWKRNYAIITLLLDGKIRNAELLDLKLSDVHFATEDEPWNDLLVRKGKGNKSRYVSLNDISVSALKIYLASGIRPADVSDDDYLFGTTAEHRFGGKNSGFSEWHRGTPQWLSKTVEEHVKAVTGKAGFRSHSMRHNGAIMELNSGTPIERIQAELGHSSVQTTEIYAGHLMPKRNKRDMSEVFAVRDEWAEKNMAMLAV